MIKKYLKILILFISLLTLTTITNAANSSHIKGIYITQWTLEKTDTITNLIKRAKAAGIDTFIIDMEIPNKRYRDNIALVKESGIKYIARIVMFPGGGTKKQVENPEYWQRKYALVKQAIDWGASGIQLDYIRYNTMQRPSPENSKNVHEIIKWYKNKLAAQNIPLEIDVFGISSFGESRYIGQNIKLFSQTVDAVCPMVYPSHYVPFREHFETPYETVYESLANIQDMFKEDKLPIKVIPYIELSNYHYPMSHEKTLAYIRAQIKAAHDAGVDGWYAWSPNNLYNNLFEVLENRTN